MKTDTPIVHSGTVGTGRQTDIGKFIRLKGDAGNAILNTEKNCFSYSLNMKYTNRGHLAVVAWSNCQEGMAAR